MPDYLAKLIVKFDYQLKFLPLLACHQTSGVNCSLFLKPDPLTIGAQKKQLFQPSIRLQSPIWILQPQA